MSNNGCSLPAMPVARGAHPTGLEAGDEWNQRWIGQPDSRGKNRTAHHDSPAIDEHDVTCLSESNRMGGGREKFFGIDDPVDDADDFVPQTVHDRKADREHIGLGPVVKKHIFDEELPDSLVIGPFPPRCLPMRKRRQVRQGSHEIPLHVGDEQQLGRSPHHLRKELCRFVVRPNIVFAQQNGQRVFS